MSPNLITVLRILLCGLSFTQQVASSFLLKSLLGCPSSNYGSANLLGCNSPIYKQCGNSGFAPSTTCAAVCPTIDPVSLALALQAQKDCVREEKLQFGPKTLPLDVRTCACQTCLSNPVVELEGGLHALRNQIIELIPCCPKKTLAEEALESYCDDEEVELDFCNKPLLTYSDVGYVPEKPKCPFFVPGAPPSTCQTGQVVYNGLVPPTDNCLYQYLANANPFCAYKPGNIVIAKTFKGLGQDGCCNNCCSC